MKLRSLLPRVCRGLLAIGAGLLATGRLVACEVTVYAYCTEVGKKFSAPTAAVPASCVLVGSGWHELGSVPAGERAVAPGAIERLVRGAMTVNHYAVARAEETPPLLLLVFHWGCISPSCVGFAPSDPINSIGGFNLLALVGGTALRYAAFSERDDILRDATEDRYFLIVSAYDFAALATAKARRLLWRTQMSVPIVGLNAERAMPLLAAAGAALLGRETPLPRRISLKVEGRLSMGFEAR